LDNRQSIDFGRGGADPQRMRTAGLLLFAMVCQDAGMPDAPVQRNPDVSEAQHDTSPPLREIPPAEHKPGTRVHPVLPVPRPAPEDAGVPEKKDR
jgi:hypothetical protein